MNEDSSNRTAVSAYIVGEWMHIFDGDSERLVRWIYDVGIQTVPFVQIHLQGAWSNATETERRDVEISVQQHELEQTWQEYGCESVCEVPNWTFECDPASHSRWELQRFDEAVVFGDDCSVWQHIWSEADAGDTLCRRARRFLKLRLPQEYAWIINCLNEDE